MAQDRNWWADLPVEDKLIGLAVCVIEAVILALAIGSDSADRKFYAVIMLVGAIAAMSFQYLRHAQKVKALAVDFGPTIKLRVPDEFEEGVDQLYDKAMQLKYSGNLVGAQSKYSNVFEKRPNHWKAGYNAAFCCEKRRRFEEADKMYESLIARMCEVNAFEEPAYALIIASALGQRAEFDRKNGRLKQASEKLLEALDYSTDNPVITLNAALAFAGLGQSEKARDYYCRTRSHHEFRKLVSMLSREDFELLQKYSWFDDDEHSDDEEK